MVFLDFASQFLLTNINCRGVYIVACIQNLGLKIKQNYQFSLCKNIKPFPLSNKPKKHNFFHYSAPSSLG